MEFLIGGLSGMGAVLFTNPFDVVKTRLQLQGELMAKGEHAVHYRSVLHAMYVISRTDGIMALQKGLVSALCFQLAMNSTRLGLYHVAELKGLNRNKDGSVNIIQSVACSALSGTAGAIVASPIYLVKTQIQSSSHASIAVGQQHKHQGTWTAFTSIYQKYGVKGLFKGVTSAVPRVAIGSATQLTTFSSVKELLKDNNVCADSPVGLAFLASAVSGLFVAVAMCPFDVVSTRLYNQGADAHGKGSLYHGVGDCLAKTYKAEGFFGFYKGLGPLYLRLAPHTVLSLVFWDKLKTYIQKIT